MKKRVISLLLCLAMLIGLMPVVTLAANQQIEGKAFEKANSLAAGTSSDPAVYMITAEVTLPAEYSISISKVNNATLWTLEVVTTGTGKKATKSYYLKNGKETNCKEEQLFIS